MNVEKVEGIDKTANHNHGLNAEVLNNLNQAVVLVSDNNIIASIFAQTEAVFEQGHDALVGQSVKALRSIGPEVEDLVNRSRRDYTPLNSYDVPCAPPIGDTELMDIHATPYGEDGHILVTAQPRRITAYLEKRD